MIEVFAEFPDRLTVETRATAARLAAAGAWGPAEIVRHLIAVEREVWQVRLTSLATEDDPHWSWAEPGLEPGPDDASLDEVLAAFAAARAKTVATIGALDDAGLARHGTHATYGRLDVAGLIGIAIDHDRVHLESLARDPAAELRVGP